MENRLIFKVIQWYILASSNHLLSSGHILLSPQKSSPTSNLFLFSACHLYRSGGLSRIAPALPSSANLEARHQRLEENHDALNDIIRRFARRGNGIIQSFLALYYQQGDFHRRRAALHCLYLCAIIGALSISA